MDRKQLLQYVQKRREHISRNKTGDVFCAKCLQATIPKDGKSACCDGDVLDKPTALARAEEVINKLKFN